MAPRPKKPRNCRRFWSEFGTVIFKPAGRPLHQMSSTTLYPDEVEALNLCDGKGLTQQQAGERMGISRGTVQRLVKAARKKLAQALVQEQAIVLTAEELTERENPLVRVSSSPIPGGETEHHA